MKKLLSAIFALALCSSVAMAAVPVPEKCSVTPADALNGLVLAPDSPSPIPSSVYTITVRNMNNDPIPNSTVTFEFTTGIRRCTTMVMSGVTNNLGVVVMTLRGGGCAHNSQGAGIIKASGITIRSYLNVKSPDYDGVGANGQVNLADLVTYKAANPCHDYNNDGSVNLSDLVIFSGAFSPSHVCTLVP